MADNIKIKAKQIDIASVQIELEDTFLERSDIDTELFEASLNPVSSKAVYETLIDKAPVENPVFTGTVTLPPIEDETGDENLRAATVGYVINKIESIGGNVQLDVIDGGEI